MITRRQLVGVMAVLAVSAAMTGSALAADIAGKWKSEFQAPDGNTRTNVFTFEVTGEAVTGTVTSSMAPEPAKIEEGTLKGDVLSFKVTRSFGGNDLKLTYTGTVKGDEIPLKVSTTGPDGQAFEFEIVAKREK
jgi:hypothetical protein